MAALSSNNSFLRSMSPVAAIATNSSSGLAAGSPGKLDIAERMEACGGEVALEGVGGGGRENLGGGGGGMH